MRTPDTPRRAEPRNNDTDKSGAADQPKKRLPPYITDPDRWKKRPNRFNRREVERALLAGTAAGAERVELNPATGIYTFVLPGKSDAAASGKNPWDEVLTNAADQKRPT